MNRGASGNNKSAFDKFFNVENSPILRVFKGGTPQPRTVGIRANKRFGKEQQEGSPGGFTFHGEIQAGSRTMFSIAGKDFIVDDHTWIVGEIELGAKASVKGVNRKGDRYALKVVITPN
jgi:hypothetical protein